MMGMTQTAYAGDGSATWSENITFDDDASFESGVNVTGNITVTIAKDKTVTVNNGITTGNAILTVKGKGKLIVTSNAGTAYSGSIVVDGGTVSVTGNGGGAGIEDKGTISVINGGSLKATGGNGNSFGGDGVNVNGGTISVEGGSLTATGGNGSSWGGAGINAYYGQTISVTDGSLTATGGNGNTGGRGLFGGTINFSGGTVSLTGGNNGGAATSGVTIKCSEGGTVEQSDDGNVWTTYSGTGSTAKYVKAEVSYPLWVGGTQVTSANKDDVLGTADEGAKVKFTPATTGENTTPAKLTLSGANITTGQTVDQNTYGIRYTGSDGLNIELASDTDNNVIGATQFTEGIYAAYADISISGKGKLTAKGVKDGILASSLNINDGKITGEGEYAIFAQNDLTINSGTVTGTGQNYGLYANGSVIIKDKAKVNATGTDHWAIKGNVKNAIAGTGWTDTAGTQDKTDIAVNTTGQTLDSYKKVQFPAEYPLWVGGTQVTSANKDNVLNDEGKTVSFTRP